MKVIRSKLEGGFVQIPNDTARNHRISWRARGLLAELLSYPPGWETTVDKLVAQAKREGGKDVEGRDAMRKAMSELEKAGYVVYRKYRHRQNGRDVFATEIIVHDVPCAPDYAPWRTDNPSVGESVRRGSSTSVDQASESQGVFKKTATNTVTKTVLEDGQDDQVRPLDTPFGRYPPPGENDDDTEVLDAEIVDFFDPWADTPVASVPR